MEMFDSLNQYDSLQSLEAVTVEELLSLIRQIKKPIQIVQIISHGGRVHAIIKGDFKIKKLVKNKEVKNG